MLIFFFKRKGTLSSAYEVSTIASLATDSMRLHVNVGKWWAVMLVQCLIVMKPASGQGVACFKCMTTDPKNDSCQDPFSSVLNPIQNNCQATAVGKSGTFPARFCVKITGRVTSVDQDANSSYLNTVIYYRTCVVDNIMDSTKSLESPGNFRLKGFQAMTGSIRLQGYMALCTTDGCNHGRLVDASLLMTFVAMLFTWCMNE